MTESSISAPTMATPKDMAYHPGPVAANPSIDSSTHSIGVGMQETASLFMQTAPYVQQTATPHRIGLPKPYASIPQPPVSLANAMTGTTIRCYTELRQQQTKAAREGSIKLVGLFFLVKRGNEANAPTQVCCLTNVLLYVLIGSNSCPAQINWISSKLPNDHSHQTSF